MACADVTSANVVGYVTGSLNANCKATGASFLTIGATGAKLSDFAISGITKSNGEIQIQILDELGVNTRTYRYFKGGRGAYSTDGWYKPDNSLVTKENDVEFAIGDGLWVKGLSQSMLTTTGEVWFDDVVKDLNANCVLLSNPYPMPVLLSNITISGISKSNGEIQIQILDELGRNTSTYRYFKGGRGAYSTDGWYKPDNSLVTKENDAEFAIGDGLWVKGLTGAKLTFSLGTKE